MTKRSTPGAGEPVGVYVLGPAEDFVDSIVGAYCDTAMCADSGEDFAVSGWPVVVKAKRSVSREQLVRHLLDLAAALELGRMYIDVPDDDD